MKIQLGKFKMEFTVVWTLAFGFAVALTNNLIPWNLILYILTNNQ